MRLTCPACHAEVSLEAALGREADARAVAELLEQGLPFGAAVVRYIGLFRPAKRRLGIERMAALVLELLPDIQRGAIQRKGRDWAAPQAVWRQAIDQVLANRDKGVLTLPLSSHGYLYEVIAALADKNEAAQELAEESRRRGLTRPAGDSAAPVAQVLDTTAAPPAPAAPPPYDPNRGPSRAARELQERIRASQLARSASTTDASEDQA